MQEGMDPSYDGEPFGGQASFGGVHEMAKIWFIGNIGVIVLPDQVAVAKANEVICSQ